MAQELSSTFISDNYTARLDAILNVPLSPENITSYADSALDQTVDLVTDYTDDYRSRPTIIGSTQSRTESAAAHYFGLSDIDEVLEHLGNRSAQISAISSLIGRAITENHVIIPPGKGFTGIEASDGSFESKGTIERLKTTLFILENEFDVTISNEDELHMAKGIVPGNTFRKESYYAINATRLERIILVCDEESNLSFVFDAALLGNHGISTDVLLAMTKPELKNLLKTNPKVGTAVRYSESFVSNMAAAIEDPADKKSIAKSIQEVSYLRQDHPRHTMTSAAFARLLKVSPSTMKKALQDVGDNLGEGYMTAKGVVYDPWQLNKVWSALESRGVLANAAPEGWCSIYGMSKLFDNFSRPRIKAIVEELITEADMPQVFKTGEGAGRPAEHYPPSMVEKVRSYLSENNMLIPRAPEGYASKSELVRQFGAVVLRTVAELRDQLGDTSEYKFGSVVAEGFSPDQVQLIELLTPQITVAPEGYATAKGMADMFDLDGNTVRKVIADLKDVLGDATLYKNPNSPQPFEHYSPDQIAIIRQTLEAKSTLSKLVPEGYMTVIDMMSRWGVSQHSVYHAIEKAGLSLSDMPRFKTHRGKGGRPAAAFAPEHHESIKRALEDLR